MLAPYVRKAAEEYGAPYFEMISVIKGESDCTMATGKAGEKGFAQFMPETYRRYADQAGVGLPRESPEGQLRVMAFAFAQGPQARREWTIWRKLFSFSYPPSIAWKP